MISRKGNIKKDLAIMFNHGDIGEIVCRGYEDDERRFRSLFLNTGALIIPGISEPPVRTLRATIPENERHIFR